MNADGSQQTRLTATPASDQAPLWSADGRITFTSDRDGENRRYSMNADGGGQVSIGAAP
jgi:Tol biopolymer transport system component